MQLDISQIQLQMKLFPCFIALASTAGTQDRMCHTAPFSTRPMDFFLCFGTYPSLPAVYRRMGEQCSSSSPQIQLQLKTSPVSEPQPPMASPCARYHTCKRHPLDFFPWLAAYPSLAPKLCRSSNLAVVVQANNGNAPAKALVRETVESCSDGVLWSNPHPAPSDCFPYTRASASMAGTQVRVRDTTCFHSRPMDFFP
jgi:hypothetical protein